MNKLLIIIFVLSLLVLTSCSNKNKEDNIQYSTLLLKAIDIDKSPETRDPYYIDADACIFQDYEDQRVQVWCGELKKDSWEEIKVRAGVQDKKDPNKWYNSISFVANKKGEYYTTRIFIGADQLKPNQQISQAIELRKIMDIDLKVEGKITDGISYLNLTIYGTDYGNYRSISTCFKKTSGIMYIKTNYDIISSCSEQYFNFSKVTINAKGQTIYEWYGNDTYRCGIDPDNIYICDYLIDSFTCKVPNLVKPSRYSDYDSCIRFEKTLNENEPNLTIQIETRTFMPFEEDHITISVFDKDRSLKYYLTTGFFPDYSDEDNNDVGAMDKTFDIYYENK